MDTAVERHTEGPPPDWDETAFARSLGGNVDAPGAPGGMESSLAQAREAMVGDPPAVPLPSDGMVTLNRGLLFEDEWQRQALMRETTGEDEEVLARFDLTKVGAVFSFWDVLLARTCVSLGRLNFEEMPMNARQGWLRQLLIGERDALFLALVRATWGPVRTIEEVRCPYCNELSDQNVVLEDTPEHSSDFPAKVLDDPEKIWYEFKLRKGGNVELRLPVGEDIMAIQSHWRQEPTAAERNTAILGRLISKHNGAPVADPVKFAKRLGTPDRQALTEFVVESQPGPRLGGVETACAHCEQKFNLELGLPRLLQL